MTAPVHRPPVRLLHLPNERGLDLRHRQVSARKGFEHLLETGELASYDVFSFLMEAERLLDVVDRCRPGLIFWQHNNEFEVTASFLRKLKQTAAQPKLVYHDEDPYGRFLKPMPGPMRALLQEADLVFLGGLGRFADLARRYGARRVRFARHCFDSIRYGQPWTPTLERETDAVMIGNYGGHWIPGRSFTGAKTRRRLAQALSRRYGRRFALYGSRWEGIPSARGRLPFVDQEKAIQSAWVSVNWDHFDDVPFYHSNRLPISLAAGVPHVTSRHAGYDALFGGCEALFAVDSVDEAVATVGYLLSLPPERLNEIGRAGRRYAYAHLEANVVYRDILDTCRHLLPLSGGPAASEATGRPGKGDATASGDSGAPTRRRVQRTRPEEN
jgi:hypothetical protein